MCRRVFNKTIILRGRAGYEMIYITNEAPSAELVMIISYPASPSENANENAGNVISVVQFLIINNYSSSPNGLLTQRP